MVGSKVLSALVALLAGSLSGCSSPNPPDPVGALSITIGGGDCAWPNTGTNLPEGQVLQGATSASQVTGRVFAQSCKVSGDDVTGYTVAGKIETDNNLFEVSTVSPVSTAGGSIRVSYSERNPPLGLTTQTATPCTVRALEIFPSAAFIEFSCTSLENPAYPTSTCVTTNARAIFENCTTTP